MNEYMELFKKLIRDEITASIVYIKMAHTLSGFDGTQVAEHLIEHADEEYGHYKQLLDFAARHGIDSEIDYTNIDDDVISNAPSGDINAIMMYTQDLEETAIEDYKKMGEVAKENNAFEARTLFVRLMREEQEHFDDFANWTGQTRPCMMKSEKPKEAPKSSKDNDDEVTFQDEFNIT